jgi:hypothetical protein
MYFLCARFVNAFSQLDLDQSLGVPQPGVDHHRAAHPPAKVEKPADPKLPRRGADRLCQVEGVHLVRAHREQRAHDQQRELRGEEL